MLIVENLSFGYQYRRLIHNLSFTLPPGKLVHLVGPNGCGKTTLMSLVAGLIAEESGTIAYQTADGQDVDRTRHLEYLPAEANCLYGKMSALQNLRFWSELRGHGSDSDSLGQELARWDLNHPYVRDHLPVEKFSTGMKRRLALARVSLAKVPCWLLDEPLYGLDTRGIATFQTLLASHLKTGGSALVVSHEVHPLAPLNPITLALKGGDSDADG